MLLCDSEGCAGADRRTASEWMKARPRGVFTRLLWAGAYHLKCLAPPLAAVPEGSWFCPSCASAADCGQCSACLDMPKFGGGDYPR